MDTMEAVNC